MEAEVTAVYLPNISISNQENRNTSKFAHLTACCAMHTYRPTVYRLPGIEYIHTQGLTPTCVAVVIAEAVRIGVRLTVRSWSVVGSRRLDVILVVMMMITRQVSKRWRTLSSQRQIQKQLLLRPPVVWQS